MKYLDLSLATPAEDLALDEALLECCDENPPSPGGVLRFYEPAQYCVVLGYGNHLAQETDSAACRTLGIPILRRISGGGTVVLGPGCLAYALVLPIDTSPALLTVTGANHWIMERNRRCLAPLCAQPIGIQGYTDLTVGDRKFSGNAQRRRRQTLLFHGTFLLAFDLDRIGQLLPMPAVRPAYRADRDHKTFLANLGIPAARVKDALRREWLAIEPWTEPMGDRVTRLMRDRYGQNAWHTRR